MSKSKFLRKSFSVALCAALIGGTAAAMPFVSPESGIEVQAANSDSDFEWSDEYDGGYTVNEYVGTATNVIIPSTHKGKPVKGIAGNAFKDNGTITSVVIPSTVTSLGDIGGGPFWGCSRLKSITIPDSVTFIGQYAFGNCISLENVTLPKYKKDSSIGQGMFEGCASLKSINFQNWTSIPSSMFKNCSFTSFTVPNTIKYIDDLAFTGCKNLVSVYIPDSVQEMGANIFDGCTSLKKVRLSNNLKSISYFCFYECSSLEEIIIPYGVTSIINCAFTHCVSLKKIVIPETVTEIHNYAFLQIFQPEKDEMFSHLVICGKKNSEAEKYAKEKGFMFTPYIEATGVSSAVTNIKLNPNGTYKINATVKPSNATITTLTWKSSNTNIATVSSDGTVKAKGSGSATITATTADNKTATYSVTVYGTPTTLTLSNAQMSLGKGETTKLTATVGPQYAKDKTVKWRTSNSKVLTVDQKGNVKAVGTGTAWITATANGNSKLSKSCKITVKNAPTKVTLTKGILTIGVGESYTLGASVNDGAAAAKRTYRTSNSSVVKMTRTDWNGVFVGQKPGIAYVTVKTYNGKESTCKVTVKAAPSSVTISKKNLTLKVGQTATLSCSVPSNAGCATRTFRTSNASVVKMTKTNWTGSFKAMKPGVAYVTVRTYNGKESTCKVTVVR